jgi:hypothetical protein
MQLSDVSEGVHKCDHTRDAGRKQLDDGVDQAVQNIALEKLSYIRLQLLRPGRGGKGVQPLSVLLPADVTRVGLLAAP